ncbi:MAG: septum formation initiator family protein [Solirubrobacterales bacterium]|nr:septum formation initiator family protein [Solirubrobacterales bacterium]
MPQGIRMDRGGRTALLLGLAVILAFYVSAGIKFAVAHVDGQSHRSEVLKLQKENRALQAKRRALSGQMGVATEARRLGMVLPGEIPYVVTGLPGDKH